MDFVKALTYPFDDADWVKKALIGCAIILGLSFLSFLVIPAFILGIVIQGYVYEIMKRVRRNDSELFPAWDNFSGFLGQGWQLFLGQFIVGLPLTLLICSMIIAFQLPTLGLVSTAGTVEDPSAIIGGLGALSFILISICTCLMILYAFAAAFNNLAALIRYMDREEISTFLQVTQNYKLLTGNLGIFGTGILFNIGGALITSLLSSTGIGGLVSPLFSAYFTGHVLGQVRVAIDEASGANKDAAPAV